jgi:hypothetical protein
MSNTSCGNLTSAFIDLATYDELEKYMYGGKDATAYFVRETRKATWFSQCPVALSLCNGNPEFGAEWSCTISRAGDYLLGTWLHVVTPEVSLRCDASNSVCIAWTPNFMHALVQECCISFNDLVAARFDGTHLDFWAAFTTPASKANGYKKMIGSSLPTYGTCIPSQSLNLPLPFFYTRDSGVALPTAALPYNEMRINFKFRSWKEMLLTFRESGNCPNGDYYGPAMAVEHPQTQTNALNVISVTGYGATPEQIITVQPADVYPTISANGLYSLRVGGYLAQSSKLNLRTTIVKLTKADGSDFATVGGPPTQAELTASGFKITVVKTDASVDTITVAGGALDNNISPSLHPNALFDSNNVLVIAANLGNTTVSAVGAQTVFTVPDPSGSGFTQVGAQERVSRTNYASPFFSKRNCPVVSVAADQLQIGGAINGFQVDEAGEVSDANLGGNNPNPTSSVAFKGGIFNDQYAHMNYDAEVCNKCLLMNGTDTGLFNSALLQKTPSLGSNAVQVWANYAIVSNEERSRMSCAPRDILIEQVQSTPASRFGGQTPFPVGSHTSQSQHYDIRFSHAVKVIFFGAKNTTFKTVHSNYSTGVPCLSKQDCGAALSVQSLAGAGSGGLTGDQLIYALGLTNGPNQAQPNGVSLQTSGSAVTNAALENIHAVCDVVSVNTNIVGCVNAQDPIARANLVYENTQRLGFMGSDYYSHVQPYYHAPAIPDDSTSPVFCAKGYHMYSYSLDFMCLDPMGSTNYGKLTNVSINATPSDDWGTGACVSNQSLQVLYDTNGSKLPSNFAGGSDGSWTSDQTVCAVLDAGRTQCAGGLKFYNDDHSNGSSMVSLSIDDLLLLNMGHDAAARHNVTGGHGLINTTTNTQKFSFQFVCTMNDSDE